MDGTTLIKASSGTNSNSVTDKSSRFNLKPPNSDISFSRCPLKRKFLKRVKARSYEIDRKI